MYKKILSVLAMSSALVFAADAAGTVSAGKGLQLNGRAVPVAGTKTWPVATGDELKSDAAPLVLTMKDGSKIVLGKNSQAKVEAGTVRLLSGTMQYELAQESTLRVAVKGDVLPARSGTASTMVGQVPPASIAPTVATEELPPVSRRKP